jgi:hypothetical protein
VLNPVLTPAFVVTTPRDTHKRRSSLAISLIKINQCWSALSLTLLVSWISITDHTDNTLATDHLAVPANFLY